MEQSRSLEQIAQKSGLRIVRPPSLEGRSGVSHRFSLLTRKGSEEVAFDLYDRVDDVELLRSYLKGYDTGAVVRVVSTESPPTEKAISLAKELRVGILTADSAESLLGSGSLAVAK